MTDNTDGSDGEGGKGNRKRQPVPKNSDEYKVRRNRNNTAVKKSRSKSRQKAKETVAKVNRLRQENDVLEQKVQILTKELSILKELFLTHAGPISDGTCQQQPDNNIQNDHKYFKKE
ncbi:hypothetical protein LOTGIDRAFT_134056 [Lottia gigantea]|uniref:BZIP domain-containing protein n=1 Tax=Lottia gigantea TaxID=225164 RepID=V3ZQC8_LOTGI|nr:hypothetical protein LOTGIDRAFT_134056 [Lottia gigantea]ESO83086.1 hypothetical protein LOTGIDRAFT_134056 [Lottia gigantea]